MERIRTLRHPKKSVSSESPVREISGAAPELRLSVFQIVGLVLLFAIVGFFIFRPLWDTYFMQDEWASQGQAFVYRFQGQLEGVPIIVLFAGYQRFFGTLLNNLFYIYFPLNYYPFVIFGIGMHVLNTFLAGYFIYRLTKNRFASLSGMLFFFVATVSRQAVTWFAAATTALPSVTCMLLCLIFFERGIEKKKSTYILLSFISLIVSYYFKESGVLVLLSLPILLIGRVSKAELKRLLVAPVIVVTLFVFTVVSIRLWYLQQPQGRVGAFISTSQRQSSLFTRNILLYPISSMSQIFMPEQLVVPFFDRVGPKILPFVGQRDTQALVEWFSIFVSCGLIIGSFFFGMYFKRMRVILFSLGYLGMSFLPYVILIKGGPYLDSRYFYPGLPGAAVLFGVVTAQVWVFLITRRHIFSGILAVIWCLAVAGYLYKNASLTRADNFQLAFVARERKELLAQIHAIYPVLPSNPIFYITGNTPAYYGVGNLHVPLQQGVGYTLLVTYFGGGNVDPSFVDDVRLWDIRFEGAVPTKTGYVAYFSTFENLKTFLNNTPGWTSSQLIALFYDGNSRTVRGIRDDVLRAIQHPSQLPESQRNSGN